MSQQPPSLGATLELFSGTQPFSRHAASVGYSPCITLDNNPVFSQTTTICENILDWDYKRVYPDRCAFKLIWASIPCRSYSNAKRTGPPRDLVTADAIALRTLDILAYYAPGLKYYFIENPWTGMLKRRGFMQGYNSQGFFVIDYCQYDGGESSRKKATVIWSILPKSCFAPKRCPLDASKCPGMEPGTKRHRCTPTGKYWDKCKWPSKKHKAIETGIVPMQLVIELIGSVLSNHTASA